MFRLTRNVSAALSFIASLLVLSGCGKTGGQIIIGGSVQPPLQIILPLSVSINQNNFDQFKIGGTCFPDGGAVRITTPVNIETKCQSGKWGFVLNLSSRPDGNITFHIQLLDDQRKEVAAQDVTIYKDTDPASLTLVNGFESSVVTSANRSSFAVSGTCSEAGRKIEVAGPANYTAEINCAQNRTFAATLDLSAVPDGPLVLVFRHTDVGGNAATRIARLKKDTVAPTLVIYSPSVDSVISFENQSGYLVQGTCTDHPLISASGATITIGGDAAAATAICGDDNIWSVAANFSSAPDGIVTLRATISDAYGNTTETARRFLKEATIVPVVTIDSAGLGSSPSSSLASRSLSLGGTGITHYKALVITSGSCDRASFDGIAEVTIGTPFAFTPVANALNTVCAIGRTSAGTWQPDSQATSSLSLLTDTLPPKVLVDSSGLGSSPTNHLGTREIAMGGDDVAQYKAVALNDLNCSSADFSSVTAIDILTPFTFAPNLGDGPYVVCALGRDATGNWQSTPTASAVLMIATVAPPIAIDSGSMGISPSNDSSPRTVVMSGAGLTHYKAIVINTGTCESADFWDADPFAIDQTFTFTPKENASSTVCAIGRDAAMNWNVLVASSQALVIDTIAPTIAIDSSNLPSSAIKNSDALELNLSGTDAVAYKAIVTTNSTCAASLFDGVSERDISLKFTFNPANNATSRVCAIGRDLAGNWQAVPSVSSAVTVDTIVPLAPLGWTMVSPNSGSFSSNFTPRIRGAGITGEEGSVAKIYTDNSCSSQVGSATISSGSFTVTNIVFANNGSADGAKTFHGLIVDRAGNSSDCTDLSLNYTLDTVAPAIPSGWSLVSPANGSTSSNSNPQITGSGLGSENDSTVAIFTNNTCSSQVGSATIAGGSFSVTNISFASNGTQDGPKSFYGRITDRAGNATACTNLSLGYTLDTAPPTVPMGWTMASPINGSTSSDNTPQISGGSLSSENGGQALIYSDVSCTVQVGSAAIASGSFTVANISFATDGSEDGLKRFYGAIQDQAGNLSPCTNLSLSYTLDTTAPAAPSGWTMASPANGSVSNDGTPQISGTGLASENGGMVLIFSDASCASQVGSASISSGGFTVSNVSYSTNGTQDGAKVFYGKVVDVASNASACTNLSLGYTLDTIAPIVTPANWAMSTPGNGTISSNTTPTLSATITGEANTTANVYDTSACSGSPQGSATVAGDGSLLVDNISYLSNGTDDGAKSFYARLTDAAGNSSACTQLNIGYTLRTLVATISSVSVPDGPYTPGQNMNISVVFARSVTVAGGIPSLTLTVGAAQRTANYISGSGSTTLVFRYTVASDDADNDGVEILSPIAANGATVQDNLGGSATLTFTDVHAAGATILTPSISVSDVTTDEWGVASVVVSVSPAAGANVTVDYYTSSASGTAVENTDYIPVSTQTLTIPAGRTSVAIPISILWNNVAESARDFMVHLTNPVNAPLSNSSAKVTITDDDSNPPPLLDVARISVSKGHQNSARHTCAITSLGAAKCWGLNESGQLGDGTTVNSSRPVDVTSLSADVSTISAGNNFTCAIVNGAAKCWGTNTNGRLGNGSTVNSPTPVQVTGLTSGVTDISSGGSHACAVINGAAKCWGLNSSGQLGNSSTTQSTSPVQVTGLTSGVVAVSVGDEHSCALLSTGGVRCWGNGNSGRIGNNNTNNATAPANVSGLSSGVTAIAAGYAHNCALLDTGAVKCWGAGTNGGLGTGTTSQANTPVSVTGIDSGATRIAAGYYASCALVNDALKCWGMNTYGQLGNGTLSNSNVPVDVPGLSSGVTEISHGSVHMCVLMGANAKCWGNNDSGQVGNGQITGVPIAVDSGGFTVGVSAAAAGTSHSCAVVNGAAKCWGMNSNGQLGSNSTVHSSSPINVNGLSTGVTAISAGDMHTCAIVSGAARCWGANGSGRLGNGSTTQSNTPVQVSGLTSGTTSITVGYNYSCAVLNGGAKCWGSNTSGQLGNSGTTDSSSPVNVTGLTTGVSSVSSGHMHTCALLSSGAVKCWGMNAYGQLGNGSTTASNKAVDVTGLSSGATSITNGSNHSCAVIDGAAKCWGQNNKGQLGNNSTSNSSVPVQVTGLSSGVVSLAAGSNHTCAVLDTGAMKCWGDNSNGQLGTSGFTDSSVPVEVSRLASGVKSIASGAWGSHTFAIVTNAGGLKGFGKNAYNEIGEVRSTTFTPVDVVSP